MAQRPTTEDIYRGNGQSEKSAGQLMKEVTEDLSTLVRKEIELAKQEVGAAISTKVRGPRSSRRRSWLFADSRRGLAGSQRGAHLGWGTGCGRDLIKGYLWSSGQRGPLAKRKLPAPVKTELNKREKRSGWARPRKTVRRANDSRRNGAQGRRVVDRAKVERVPRAIASRRCRAESWLSVRGEERVRD